MRRDFAKSMKKILISIAIVLVLGGFVYVQTVGKANNTGSIKIGFIGAMTGPVAKEGMYEAVRLAVDDINSKGGINSHPIELIAEDGRCDSKTAVDAMNKLINIDKVKIVLGGHCTPESLAIAPVAQANKVLMLASITTSPALTGIGDYVLRTSPVSVVQADLVSDLAYNKIGVRKMAIVYEQTDYSRPIAEKMRDNFSKLTGEVVVFEAYTSGTTDFRTVLTKIKSKGADSIYLSALSPDSTLSFMKQTKELGLSKIKLFGNDAAGMPVNIQKEPKLYEGFVFGLPDFDANATNTKSFIDEYNKKYGTTELPYGIWTAECYDAVQIIANEITKNGMDIVKIKNDLHNLKDYKGVSGTFSIGSDGNGIRDYSLRIVKNGKIEKYNQ